CADLLSLVREFHVRIRDPSGTVEPTGVEEGSKRIGYFGVHRRGGRGPLAECVEGRRAVLPARDSGDPRPEILDMALHCRLCGGDRTEHLEDLKRVFRGVPVEVVVEETVDWVRGLGDRLHLRHPGAELL